MRWWVFVLLLAPPTGAARVMAIAPPFELGVLACTPGRVVDTVASAQNATTNEAVEVACSFKSPRGPPETYAGLVKAIGGVGALPGKNALLWSVRVPAGTNSAPGLLQQSYVIDSATPTGQEPALIGERNSAIALQTLVEKQVGSATKEKQPPPPFVVTDMDLVLKTTAG